MVVALSVRLFPTLQWLDEYGAELSDSAALGDIGADWGVGFNGDVLIVITDLPLAETTISDLPPEVISDVPADVCADVADVPLTEAPSLFDGPARDALPDVAADLLDQLEDQVVDGNIYAYIGLEEGNCTGVEVLDGPDEREAGTTVTATCETWQQIIEGRPVVSALLSGDLKLSSTGWKGLEHPLVLQALGSIAADVDTVHIFEEPDTTFGEFVMDSTVRQPVAFQKAATRQMALANKIFSPF